MKRTETAQDADLIIQKIPSDSGIHRNPRKGTLNAPEKVLENLNTSKKVLVDEVFPNEFDLKETHRRIRKSTETLLEYGKPIVSLGGDHSVSFEILKALKTENQDLELVWLDSHLDLKKKVNGNVSHDVLVRELVDSSSFKPSEIHFIGTTQVDDDEEEYLESRQFNVVKPDEAVEYVGSVNSEVYVSCDIDVLNKEQAPGTGYPDGQMSLENVLKVIENLDFTYGDLVEVAPPFDKKGETVENAASILNTMIEKAVPENQERS